MAQFTVHTRTSHGFGLFKVNAKDFDGAFKKLSPSDRKAFLSIEDENGNEKQADEFLKSDSQGEK